MNATKTAKKEITPARKARNLEEEIAAQRAKLKALEDRQKEQQRKERERNQRAVMEIIKGEKLDTATPDQWAQALPAIKTALFGISANPHQADSQGLDASNVGNAGSREGAFSTNPQTP